MTTRPSNHHDLPVTANSTSTCNPSTTKMDSMHDDPFHLLSSSTTLSSIQDTIFLSNPSQSLSSKTEESTSDTKATSYCCSKEGESEENVNVNVYLKSSVSPPLSDTKKYISSHAPANRSHFDDATLATYQQRPLATTRIKTSHIDADADDNDHTLTVETKHKEKDQEEIDQKNSHHLIVSSSSSSSSTSSFASTSSSPPPPSSLKNKNAKKNKIQQESNSIKRLSNSNTATGATAYKATATATTASQTQNDILNDKEIILKSLLTKHIPNPSKSHWSTTYEANNPSEDRYASLTNVILTPNNANHDPTTATSASASTSTPLIRMSLFTVLDGHGGAACSEYASHKLLPMLVNHISHDLKLNLLELGDFNVNGKISNKNKRNDHDYLSSSLSFDDDLSDCDSDHDGYDDNHRNHHHHHHPHEQQQQHHHHEIKRKWYTAPDQLLTVMEDDDEVVNVTHDSEQEDYEEEEDSDYNDDESHAMEDDDEEDDDYEEEDHDHVIHTAHTESSGTVSANETATRFIIENNNNNNDDSRTNQRKNALTPPIEVEISTSNSNSSVPHCSSSSSSCPPTPKQPKTIRSVSEDGSSSDTDTTRSVNYIGSSSSNMNNKNNSHASNNPFNNSNSAIGQHSKKEKQIISRAIQKSFIEIDENWMNSIDPKLDKQTGLVRNGKCNSGSCCLVNIVIQRLDPYVITSSSSCATATTRTAVLSMASTASSSSSSGDDEYVSCNEFLSDEDNAHNSMDHESVDHDDHSDFDDHDSIDHYEDEEGGDNDNDQLEKSASIGYRPSKAIVYSAHTGDCRSILLTTTKNSSSKSSRQYNDVGSDSECNSNSDSSSCSSSDGDDEIDSDSEELRLSGLFSSCYDRLRKRPLNMMDNVKSSSSGSNKRCRLWNWSTSQDAANEEYYYGEKRQKSQSNTSSSVCSIANSIEAFQPSPITRRLLSFDLTNDHTPYNENEAKLVRKRCNYATHAIAASSSGGIKRVAGSLSVTRALGDAYLKTPTLSFYPYNNHAPYITALPEVNSRILEEGDRMLVLASDGVWERVSGNDVSQCIKSFYKASNKRKSSSQSAVSSFSSFSSNGGKINNDTASATYMTTSKSVHRLPRMRMLPTRSLWKKELNHDENEQILTKAKVSDAIVSHVLNQVRKKHKMRSMKELMDLPKGHKRRVKHDDITNMVIDLKGFVL